MKSLKATCTRARTTPRHAALPVVLSVATGVLTALLEIPIGLGVIAALLAGVVALQIQILVTIDQSDIEAQIAPRAQAPAAVFDLELEHRRDVLLEHYKESVQRKVRVDLRASPGAP
jgi:hypothetical protein